MEYIFPVPLWLRGKILEHKRLYAFPTIPEENPFILDSGAFALSKSGGKMDDEYLERLYRHYKKYSGWCVWCVAPDEYANPKQTMKNFEAWRKKYSECQIWPVIQCVDKKIEWPIIQYQLDFYSYFFNRIEMLFFASPKSFKAFQIPKNIFQKIKDEYRIDWIHLFGAGFYPQDIQAYANISKLDSIDSTAYYNAVNKIDGNWTAIKGTRQQKTLANVQYIQKIL